jgi:hypothetical protein
LRQPIRALAEQVIGAVHIIASPIAMDVFKITLKSIAHNDAAVFAGSKNASMQVFP